MLKRLLKYFIIVCVVSTLAVSGGVFGYMYKLSLELPSTKDLKDYEYKRPTIIYDRNGKTIAELGSERRYPLNISDIPESLQNAVVAVEDARFYDHGGVDLMGIMRAFITNIKAGRVVEGGSTLTQQLIKIIYLTPEKKLKRKVKEAILAYRIDKALSKKKVLEMYLNQVYFGRGAYGVEAAAVNYFAKSVNDLSLAEAAMIAGVPKAPGIYAPHLNPEKALKRRNHVLFRMLETGYINEDTYQKASMEEAIIIDKIPPKNMAAGYFVDFIIRHLKKVEGVEDVATAGLNVYTTLDLDIQKNAEDALKNNLLDMTETLGFRGALVKYNSESDTLEELLEVKKDYLQELGFEKALVTKVSENFVQIKTLNSEGTLNIKENRWARPYKASYYRNTDFRRILDVNDIIYVTLLNEEEQSYRMAQEPELESALLSANQQTGEIYAMVGGFDYRKSMFNRAEQAKRQVGSLFKPIVYSTAIESGMNVMSQILDAPVIKEMEEEGEFWKPENYSGKFFGHTTLKEALTKSRNLVTIKVAEKVGISKIINQARKFGMKEELNRDLSVSIGSGTASLMEMVFAFSTFPNLGVRHEPYYVTKIENSLGDIVAEYQPSEPIEVLKEGTAHIMIDMMRNVVVNGTGKRALVIPKLIAGKTGTTNDNKDTWFIGYMPDLVSGVWVGFDDFQSIGKYRAGSNTALPAWVKFTKSIHHNFGNMLFPVSKDIAYFRVDSESHKITNSFTGQYTFEPFEKPMTMTEQN
ncbi:MAG: penicillin-binding protein [Denitrovibrio sp.]|nr:MAG: penicillin-binding protein [Denitrovibrio sp.]